MSAPICKKLGEAMYLSLVPIVLWEVGTGGALSQGIKAESDTVTPGEKNELGCRGADSQLPHSS